MDGADCFPKPFGGLRGCVAQLLDGFGFTFRSGVFSITERDYTPDFMILRDYEIGSFFGIREADPAGVEAESLKRKYESFPFETAKSRIGVTLWCGDNDIVHCVFKFAVGKDVFESPGLVGYDFKRKAVFIVYVFDFAVNARDNLLRNWS